jgi:hypothetical protein
MIRAILSSIWNRIKKWVILGVICLLALFGLKHCNKVQQKQDGAIVSPILKPNEVEKVIVNPGDHSIDIIKKNPDGTTTTTHTYLPDRPISITEGKDGSITVQSRTWGKELRPYMGAGVDLSPAARLHLGTDFFYWHKVDFGTGVGFNPTTIKDTTLNLNVSYNFYSNTSIAFSIDNHHTPGVFLKVRF